MSSILKALKKLEEEQSGRAAGSPSRTSGQFVTPLRAARPFILLIGGIGAGLLLAGGLYALFGGSTLAPPSPPPVAQPGTPAAASGASIPGTTLPVSLSGTPATPVSPPATVPVKPVPVPAPATAGKVDAAVSGKKVEVAAAPPLTTVLPEAVTETRSGAVDQVEIERRDIPAPGQQWSAANLTVSEILPASGGGHMAIVNGLPVMEGTMVDDAVVTEIGADRVIFTIDGKSVGVPLSPSR